MRGSYATLTQTSGGDFALRSSYDRGLVAALKADIPPAGRRWDPSSKVWLVDPRYVGYVTGIVERHLGIQLRVQPRLVSTQQVETKLVQVEYLGTPKDRGGDEPVAYGYADGDWSVAIPLSVLKAWFELEVDARPEDAATLYAILGVGKKVAPGDIKRAFRRAARQWHPDVCHEPDAKEQFQRINEAYQVLSDSLMRRKYDAGLAFAAKTEAPRFSPKFSHGWRPPLRCGWLLVEGVLSLGRLNVSKIKQWEDIVNANGLIMVSSWPPGGDTFEVQWV